MSNDAPKSRPISCPAPRASWNEYFMRIAREVAARSTCERRRVGAVLVRDRMILATGYNGSVRGLPHCDEAGHLMRDGRCVRTVHAEANALAQAARAGTAVVGATLFCTSQPCLGCFQLLANAGVAAIVFDELYAADAELVFDGAASAGVELLRCEPRV